MGKIDRRLSREQSGTMAFARQQMAETRIAVSYLAVFGQAFVGCPLNIHLRIIDVRQVHGTSRMVVQVVHKRLAVLLRISDRRDPRCAQVCERFGFQAFATALRLGAHHTAMHPRSPEDALTKPVWRLELD